MAKDFLKIVEVGPRDGLQNESQILSVDTRVNWIDMLYAAGCSNVEVGSVVRADRIPQMANSEEVFRRINKPDGCDASVLVPNLKGLMRIDSAKITEIGVFTAASDTFNLRNINCTVAESLVRIVDVVAAAKAHPYKIRGTVSCIAACPYDGTTSLAKVVETCEALYEMGCDEIVLGDTIGAATPERIRELTQALAQSIGVKHLALHAHDTYNNAIINVAEALEQGVRVVDSAAAGLGGCPYAPGAKGNVSTSTVIEFCQSQGIETGIDLEALQHAERFIYGAIEEAKKTAQV